MNKLNITTLMMAFAFIFTMVSCGGGAPKDILDRTVLVSTSGESRVSVLTLDKELAAGTITFDYEITNDYVESDGKHDVHYYEYESTITCLTPSRNIPKEGTWTYTGAVGLFQKGKNWYKK